MASYFPMIKNSAQRIVFPILDADGDPVTGAAADTPDSEYSLDGASFVDITDEIHEIATASGIYYLDLVAGETNGDVVCIQVKTATAGTKTTVLVFYTAAQSLDTIDTNVDSILTDTETTLPATLATIAAYIDAEVAAILVDTGELQTDWVNGGRLDLLIDAIKAKSDLLPSGVPKNVALANFPFTMVLASDHLTPATGKTVTTEISKDGGAFTGSTNSAAEIGNGAYKINLTQAEMNADVIILKFAEDDCDQRIVVLFTSD